MQNGALLYTFQFEAPVRAVEFSLGDKLAVITSDPFIEQVSAIHVKRIASDLTEREFLFKIIFPFCVLITE